MPGSTTPLGPVRRSRIRAPGVAFRVTNRVCIPGKLTFVAQWLAYSLLCRRFAPNLAAVGARLEADVTR